MPDLQAIHRRFMALRDAIDERARRLVVAAESMPIGRGGIAAVSRATGMAPQVVRRGMAELKEAEKQPAPHAGRIRRPGGGRKKTVDGDPALLRDLEQLVAPATRGDPESPLRWTWAGSAENGEPAFSVSEYSALRAGIFKAWGSFDPMNSGRGAG